MADVRTILIEAAEQAFEQLGFLMPAFEDDDAALAAGNAEDDTANPASPAPSAELAGGRATGARRGMMVRFRGPVDGAVVVRGDAGLLEALAANMLGSETTPPLPLQLDALGEIANVICGNVLPVAEDPAAVFRLDTPVAAPVVVPGEGERVRSAVEIRLDAGVAEVALLERVS